MVQEAGAGEMVKGSERLEQREGGEGGRRGGGGRRQVLWGLVATGRSQQPAHTVTKHHLQLIIGKVFHACLSP